MGVFREKGGLAYCCSCGGNQPAELVQLSNLSHMHMTTNEGTKRVERGRSLVSARLNIPPAKFTDFQQGKHFAVTSACEQRTSVVLQSVVVRVAQQIPNQL